MAAEDAWLRAMDAVRLAAAALDRAADAVGIPRPLLRLLSDPNPFPHFHLFRRSP